MAHFSLTDVERERFYSFERFSRAALGLSGARSQPFKVWLDDWVIRSQGDDLFPLQLHAATDEVAVEFQLASNKPLVLQGDGGLSRKSAEPGNASYYYSYTTMPTRGTLRIGNETFSVSGTSWMDREWSTSALADNQQGWDWFALQLSDQRELMFYQLRKKNGQPDTFSAGTLVAADGSVERIALQDIRLEPLKNWTSPVTGKTYPVKWRLALPERNLDLLVEAQVPSQEVNHRVTYWEGAVRVTGRDHGKPVTGQGYLELAGY
jgi:predicted secreted hydrolase